MKYTVRYSKSVNRKRIKTLPKKDLQRLQKIIATKIVLKPEVFGKPLRQSLKGCCGLRMGKYRIIYRVQKPYVDILLIEHRSKVYTKSPEKHDS